MLDAVQTIDLSAYLTSEELASRLGVSRWTIQRRARSGALVPDAIAPHGVLLWHPKRAAPADAEPMPP